MVKLRSFLRARISRIKAGRVSVPGMRSPHMRDVCSWTPAYPWIYGLRAILHTIIGPLISYLEWKYLFEVAFGWLRVKAGPLLPDPSPLTRAKISHTYVCPDAVRIFYNASTLGNVQTSSQTFTSRICWISRGIRVIYEATSNIPSLQFEMGV